MSADTSSPAFPTTEENFNLRREGLSQRDYFAAEAMQAHVIGNWDTIRAACQHSDDINPLIAKLSYELADAMLAERNKELLK